MTKREQDILNVFCISEEEEEELRAIEDKADEMQDSDINVSE